ncbi:MAG: 50S ribosomal protein L24 [Ghiorsea sp.]
MSTNVKCRIRSGDEIVVIAGRDKGARGKVTRVLSEKGKLIISKINMIKRHTRPSQSNAGGIVEREAPLQISNVQFVCPKCDKGVRLGVKTLDDGRKVRTCRKCGEVSDK